MNICEVNLINIRVAGNFIANIKNLSASEMDIHYGITEKTAILFML